MTPRIHGASLRAPDERASRPGRAREDMAAQCGSPDPQVGAIARRSAPGGSEARGARAGVGFLPIRWPRVGTRGTATLASPAMLGLLRRRPRLLRLWVATSLSLIGDW